MKPIISRLARVATLILFPYLMLTRLRRPWTFLMLAGMVVLLGCFRKFYNSGTVSSVDASQLSSLQSANKYFILHYQDSVYHLTDLSVNNNILSGVRQPLPPEHSKQLNPNPDKPTPFRGITRGEVLSEVHLYVNLSAATSPSPEINIPLTDIYKMNVYAFDQKRTQTSTILSIVGIVATGALIILIIVGSAGPSPSSSSDSVNCGCPQVYIEQEGNFEFQNGLYSGAVYANMERTDYLPFGAIRPDKGSIHIRISGHENEIQYINSSRVLGVIHPEGRDVLADRNGHFYSLGRPELPSEALDANNSDIRKLLTADDGKVYPFDSYQEKESFSRAYLSFRNPARQKEARLVIRARNSYWAAMMDREYTLLFGSDYVRYRNYAEKKDGANMESFLLDQGLPLRVYVENDGKWEFADAFPLSGTENYREMVMNIKLPASEGTDVKIKLESAYRFWDLDYAALDYSEQSGLQAFSIAASSAGNPALGDQREKLAARDKAYAVLNPTESIDLEFPLPTEPKPGQQVSYFLESAGYYHILNTYPVPANITRLKAFYQPGEFDRFSREKYRELDELNARIRQTGVRSH